MMTFEKLTEVNSKLPKLDIKGKDYACVPSRIQAFRELFPNGTIVTEIVSIGDGVVVMKATIVSDEGKVLATGHAYEKENSSYINKTSYIENCETSAVGRALGMIGIGSEGSLASAEELVNAINNQNNDKHEVKKTNYDVEIQKYEKQCSELGLDLGSEQFVSYVSAQIGKVDKKAMTDDEKRKYIGILVTWLGKQKK